MKIIKIFVYILICFTVFIIYKLTYNNKIDYVSLGDYVSSSFGYYGEMQYSYSDYISQYLDKNNNLNSFLNSFISNNYKITNLLDDINNNKTIEYDNRIVNIRSVLRESDLVTISIGMNDLIEIIDRDYSKEYIEFQLNRLFKEYKNLLDTVQNYAKSKIIVIGLYNPYPYSKNSFEYNNIVKQFNKKIELYCNDNKMDFIDTNQLLKNYTKYFIAPNNYYFNSSAHYVIFNQIIKKCC